MIVKIDKNIIVFIVYFYREKIVIINNIIKLFSVELIKFYDNKVFKYIFVKIDDNVFYVLILKKEGRYLI